ncbi:MAG TPA: dTDP-glucose 4,6-dehydratase [Pyrinomonadaceae bacterium]|nr:dTDP-glucose 4,6-dehydratase [Pyrinomonadaceae bacterium]
MEKIIVTGGAGFIGSNFVRHALAHTSARIVIVDNLTYAGNRCTIDDLSADHRVCFIKADIADPNALHSIFAAHRPTAVVNFAAETHVDRSIDQPRPFVSANIVGVFELLETSRQYLRDLSSEAAAAFRFLHVSTDEVYGTLGPVGLFSETTPYAPNSPYSASKAAADHLVRAYFETYRLPALITNCSNNYGPYQFPEKLIPLTILNAQEGKPLPIYGDGGNIRDWLHVEDHCAGILLVLKQGTAGEKYNVGGANERTNLEIVDTICAQLELLSPASNNSALRRQGISSYLDLKKFVSDRPGHDRRYAIDATKIRTELGWTPRFDFNSGITNTIEWYLHNHSWTDTVQGGGGYRRERLGTQPAINHIFAGPYIPRRTVPRTTLL